MKKVTDNCYWLKKKLVTQNFVPGQTVYGERKHEVKGAEYREWNPRRSKLGAAIHKRIKKIPIREGSFVLYLGSASGTTASHVSDIVGASGLVYCVEISPRPMRDLVFVAEDRNNLAPILGNAALPREYEDLIVQCDFLFQDIAQKNQAQILVENKKFLKLGGYAMISVKARSIDVTAHPKKVFRSVEKRLKKHFKVVDKKRLEPFEKDHMVLLLQK